jgi:hypothetical protein
VTRLQDSQPWLDQYLALSVIALIERDDTVSGKDAFYRVVKGTQIEYVGAGIQLLEP